MEDFDEMIFAEMTPNITEAIGCANCHEAGTMRLIVTNPALDEALKAQGKDWKDFTRQEMRTVVCANCHVEYYFNGDDKVLTFPWAKGTEINSIVAYYEEIGFKDWDYPGTGTPMLKAQHPEYEMYTAGSTHFRPAWPAQTAICPTCATAPPSSPPTTCIARCSTPSRPADSAIPTPSTWWPRQQDPGAGGRHEDRHRGRHHRRDRGHQDRGRPTPRPTRPCWTRPATSTATRSSCGTSFARRTAWASTTPSTS